MRGRHVARCQLCQSPPLIARLPPIQVVSVRRLHARAVLRLGRVQAHATGVARGGPPTLCQGPGRPAGRSPRAPRSGSTTEAGERARGEAEARAAPDEDGERASASRGLPLPLPLTTADHAHTGHRARGDEHPVVSRVAVRASERAYQQHAGAGSWLCKVVAARRRRRHDKDTKVPTLFLRH